MRPGLRHCALISRTETVWRCAKSDDDFLFPTNIPSALKDRTPRHPGDAGNKAMADAIDLDTLTGTRP